MNTGRSISTPCKRSAKIRLSMAGEPLCASTVEKARQCRSRSHLVYLSWNFATGGTPLSSPTRWPCGKGIVSCAAVPLPRPCPTRVPRHVVTIVGRKTGSGSVSSRSPERTSRAERGARSLHSFRWSSRAAGRSRDTASSSSRRRLRARPSMLSGSPNIACPATSCSTARRTSRMVFRGYPVSVHTTSSSTRMACLRALLAWLPDAFPSERLANASMSTLQAPSGLETPHPDDHPPRPLSINLLSRWRIAARWNARGSQAGPKATSVFQTIRGGRPPRHR